jgi:hypothetical protein
MDMEGRFLQLSQGATSTYLQELEVNYDSPPLQPPMWLLTNKFRCLVVQRCMFQRDVKVLYSRDT